MYSLRLCLMVCFYISICGGWGVYSCGIGIMVVLGLILIELLVWEINKLCV